MITLVLILAEPVVVIVTGLVPAVLQFVPEVPVCPEEDKTRLWAVKLPERTNETARKVRRSQRLKATFRNGLLIRWWMIVNEYN